MSDSSSFAEWETQQLQHFDAADDVLTERQQQLIDMASEHRIWADRDSSNDYRSSASEDEEAGDDGGVELPATRGGGEIGAKTVNGSSLGKLGRSLKFKGDWEIPSSSFENSQSVSQRLAREAEDEDEHPPSSQPRPVSLSRESVAVEEDHKMGEDDNDVEDPLEGFDVLESEKEFLLSLLEVAPADEIKALHNAPRTKSILEVEFYVAPAPRSAVEEFAHTHPFWSQAERLDMGKSIDLSEAEMSEFKRDVYDYARAAGMGQHQAKVEVILATAAWRKERGFGIREVLDEWDEESEVDTEIFSRRSVLVVKDAPPLVSSGAMKMEPPKKRKRSSLEKPASQNFSSQVAEPDGNEAKRQRKLEKKERKKALRDMKKQLGKQHGYAEPDLHTEDQNHVALLLKVTTFEPIVTTEPAKKKKKSKLGPTTSAYFAKPQIPDPKPKHDPPATATGLIDTASMSSTSKRVRKRYRAGSHMGTGSEVSHSVDVDMETVAPLEQAAMEDNPTAVELAATKPTSPMEGVSTVLENTNKTGGPAPESTKKKLKRKKRRNQNRLPEEQAAKIGFSKSDPSTSQELHSEKRSRTEAFIENLHDGHLEEEPASAPEIHKKGGEGVEAEPKNKRARTRKKPREQELHHDKLQNPMPSSQDAKIHNVLEHVNMEADEYDNIEDEPRPKNSRRKERLRGGQSTVLDQSQNSIPNSPGAEISVAAENVEAESRLLNSEVMPEPEEIFPPSKKRRRGPRNSEGKKNDSVGRIEPEGQAEVEPLTELANTNSKQPKEGRRERGRSRNRKSDQHSEMDIDALFSGEQSKVHHS